jgi:diacylglycerol kinase (ATP)
VTSRSLFRSFNWAIEGIVYAVRTQRNMRIHLATGVTVMIAALVLDVSRVEFLVLLFTVTMVLVAELINTSIEATIDLIATSFDPLAKIAKDVAAAAVLVASTAAVGVGFLVFFNRLVGLFQHGIDRLVTPPLYVTYVALFVTIAAVVGLKALSGRRVFTRGGMPSGHTAVAAALVMAGTMVTHSALIAAFGLLLVALVAQSRIEAGFHTFLETLAGASVGICITLLAFRLFGIG